MRIFLPIIVSLLISLPSQAQQIADVSPPTSISPQGSSLELAACGLREKLWVSVYAVALYLPKQNMTISSILSLDTAKAVILYPVYSDDLPKDLPQSWRQRLRKYLTEAQIDEMQQLYGKMTTSDTFTIAYTPGSGTLFKINDNIIESIPGGELITGVINTWLDKNTQGENPIDLRDKQC